MPTAIQFLRALPIALVCATLAGPNCTPASSTASDTWSTQFDSIRDADTLAALRAYQKTGWASVFAATGKSAQQLQLEGELALSLARTQMASDERALTLGRADRTLPAADVCKGLLSNPRETRYAVCDKQRRADDAQAIGGLIELIGKFGSGLPAPVYTGKYGRNAGTSPIARVTVQVTPSTVGSDGGAPSSQAYSVGPTDDQHVINVPQGENVAVHLSNGKQLASGFVVDPPSGVVEASLGTVHFPMDRLVVLHAVKPGTATLTFTGPMVTASNQYFCSECWSGYLTQNGNPYSGIRGAWVVPSIAQGSPVGSSATWIGLDGWSQSPLIQLGTSQSNNGGFFGIGAGPSYGAWWQVLPQFGTQQSIGFPVAPGDAMVAAIAFLPNSALPQPSPGVTSTWQLSLTDVTQAWNFQTTQSFDGELNEAEWIEEDPSDCFGSFGCWRQGLANYTQVLFDFDDHFGEGLAAAAGPPAFVAPQLTPPEALAINQNNVVFSTPSNPDADADGFYVTYTSVVPNQVFPPGPWIDLASSVLPNAVVNKSYSQGISAFEETNPFDPNGPNWSWALVGGALPAGLSLNTGSGVISGTPSALGTSSFSVQVADTVTGALSQVQTLTLTVVKTAPPPPCGGTCTTAETCCSGKCCSAGTACCSDKCCSAGAVCCNGACCDGTCTTSNSCCPRHVNCSN